MSDPYADPDPAAALENFDKEYIPAEPMRPGPDALPDGLYTAQVVEAELGLTQKTKQPIVKIVLKVEGGAYDGLVFERGSVLSSQDNIDRLGGDLIACGIPADTWTKDNGKKFSQELPKALPSLVGRRLKLKRVTTSGVDKQTGNQRAYANCYFSGLAGNTPTPQRQAGPPSSPVRKPVVHSEDDIPFLWLAPWLAPWLALLAFGASLLA